MKQDCTGPVVIMISEIAKFDQVKKQLSKLTANGLPLRSGLALYLLYQDIHVDLIEAFISK